MSEIHYRDSCQRRRSVAHPMIFLVLENYKNILEDVNFVAGD